jgi:Domain of unknown function (DUF1772)
MVHPVLWRLDHRAQVRAERLMYRRFGSIDPFLMTATIIACFAAVGALAGRPGALALAAGGCFTAMLGITLAGNVPINIRVFRWDEEHGDAGQWRRIRRRWDRLHTVRIILDLAGFLLITTALAAVRDTALLPAGVPDGAGLMQPDRPACAAAAAERRAGRGRSETPQLSTLNRKVRHEHDRTPAAGWRHRAGDRCLLGHRP